MDICVCMGTSCYIKGSPEVVEKLKKRLVNFDGISDVKVTLKGSFCLGPCIEGIIIKVGDKLIKNVNPQNIEKKIIQEIIPYIKGNEGEKNE